jgi:hypothetical protein
VVLVLSLDLVSDLLLDVCLFVVVDLFLDDEEEQVEEARLGVPG